MHTTDLLYTTRFDFPYRHDRPTIQLMVAALPRSGSTAFCLELWRTALLGAPLEYTNLNLVSHHARWKKLLRHERQYWRSLQCVRTGPNGVFSYKFFVQEYIHILRQKPRLLPCIAPSHVIYFTRKDSLAQAISYSKAIRSGAWFANVARANPCDYDESHIQECLDYLMRQEQSWEYVFQVTNTTPIRVTYEEFMSDPHAVVRLIVDYVVPGSPTPEPLQIPALDIQRDAVSDDWKARFLAYLARNGIRETDA